MNDQNDNHAATNVDELHNRLLDLALTELVGGKAPPDLLSRVVDSLETSRPIPAKTVGAPRRSGTLKWFAAGIAAMLLVGLTVLLLSNEASRHRAKTTAKVERVGSESPTPFVAFSTGPGAHAPAPSNKPSADASTLAISDPRHDGGQLQNAGPEGGPSPTPMAAQLPPDRYGALTGESGAASVEHMHTDYQADVARTRDGPGTILSTANAKQEIVEFKAGPGDKRNQLTTDSFETGGPESSAPASSGRDARYELEAYKRFLASRESSGRNAEVELQRRHLQDVAESPSDVLRTINPPVVASERWNLYGYESRDGARWGSLGYQWREGAKTTDGVGPGSSGDRYVPIVENPFIKAEGGAAVSTFSIDVDTASYTNVRQFLLQMNQLPPSDAVRIEELVNYFQYEYTPPATNDEAPFAAHVEVAGCPWNTEHRLARIAVKGREMDRDKRPQSNLVFLVDVSGSMNEPAKLPLVVYGLQQLTNELGENDHIAIVVYAGNEGLALPSTSGSKQDTILAVLEKLQAGGSTAGGAGIQLAYKIAEDSFIKGGTNRVILCTDGDFNVGVTSTAELQRMVEQKAKDTGVFLSVLGFGRGNLNDAMMEAIADHGNGNYHYVDNRTEARRVLVEEMAGTLVTIAKDVKIQVEFNPTQVAAYRLIGYENRMLRTEDFNDDKKDAGEIGAGHTVTALYEVVPAGKQVGTPAVDELKYQKRPGWLGSSAASPQTRDVPGGSATPRPQPPDTERTADEQTDKYVRPTDEATSKELLTLKMRYKAPDGDTSKKLEWPVTDKGASFGEATDDFQFASAVAGFGLLLRDSQYKGNLSFAGDLELAQSGLGRDEHGYRTEFLDMVRTAKKLKSE